MKFTINNSPFGGQEGKYVQSSRLRERLLKETLVNVAIQVRRDRETGTVFWSRAGGNFSWPS